MHKNVNIIDSGNDIVIFHNWLYMGVICNLILELHSFS